MQRRMFKIWVIVFSVLILPVRAQSTATQPAEPLAETESIITHDQAQQWVDQLTPLVEQTVGRKFKDKPKVLVAKRKDLVKALAADFMLQMHVLAPEVNESVQLGIALRMAQQMAPSMMGKYAFADGRLLIMGGQVRPLMQLTKMDPKLESQLLQLVIAHELVHALQDQEMDFANVAFKKLKDLEQIQAFSSTIEGHAVLMQDKLAEQLGAGEGTRAMARMMAAGVVKLDDPMHEMMNKVMAKQFEQIYLGGRKFMAYHDKIGGNDRLWQILLNPPTTTRVIDRPALYGKPSQKRADLDAMLKRVDPLLGLEPTPKARTLNLSSMQLRAAWANMPESDRKPLLDVYGYGAIRIYQMPSAQVVVNVLIFEKPMGSEILAATRKLVQDNVRRLEGSREAKVTAFKMTDHDLMSGVKMQEVVMRIKIGPHDVPTHICRVVYDRIMIELQASNVDLPGERAGLAAGFLVQQLARDGLCPMPDTAASQPATQSAGSR